MNSWLHCCTDLNKIKEWICVDDNSSEEDRKKMKEFYPFFTFIFKGPENKGHPKSMNIIHRTVNTPYILHMEDDWQFFIQRDYVSRMLDILNSDEKLIQALVNQNYAEKPDDIVEGGFEKWSKEGYRYREHEYNGTGVRENHKYWPHFSFRPSLHRKKYWDDVGLYNENTTHFEMEYAHRVVKKGYKSAFMPSIYCLHIGKLTNQNDKPNAYALNGENQFG